MGLGLGLGLGIGLGFGLGVRVRVRVRVRVGAGVRLSLVGLRGALRLSPLALHFLSISSQALPGPSCESGVVETGAA